MYWRLRKPAPGKTLSFLIPIIEQLQKSQAKVASALILLPTRELAMQVQQACAQLISFSHRAGSRWHGRGPATG